MTGPDLARPPGTKRLTVVLSLLAYVICGESTEGHMPCFMLHGQAPPGFMLSSIPVIDAAHTPLTASAKV